MAKPQCTMCEKNEGLLMTTNLDDGETQTVCGPCLPGYALTMAATFTEGMPADFAKAYAAQLDAIYANDSRPGKHGTGSKAAKPAAGRSEPPSPITEQDPPATVEEGTDECPMCGGMYTLSELAEHECDDDPSLDGHNAGES